MKENFDILLFDNFETLDAFGPAEIMGRMSAQYNLSYYSMHGGIIVSRQGIRVETESVSKMTPQNILLIPGGQGTRELIKNTEFINSLTELAQKAKFVLTVCTGSAFLAQTGLLDGKKATSNKRAFDWVQSVNPKVEWIRQARWVVDGNIYSSSGVSAGMDMILGFIRDLYGIAEVHKICEEIEYIWNSDENSDPFS